jgi:hypothetical protein
MICSALPGRWSSADAHFRIIALGEVATRSGGAPRRSGRHPLFLENRVEEFRIELG